ncbi:MAG: protein kinase [Anaerolineae bacterium]|nr:protein kinase [Anaerolineae bacterium]
MDPTHIGRYELHAPLGRGGMGTVYKGRDPFMERWVAVKTITVHDAAQRARFQQEARAAGSLNHPHITTIYDVGEEGDLAYIVMELVEGDTLAARLAAPVPWPEAINLLLPVADALAYAHDRGVIHRDIKPANILVSTEGKVKLTDFGVARLEAALRRITESGSTVGTPLYTAPEQLENQAVDGRADLFSLGIVLFELMTGRHPFAGETLAQVIHRIMHTPADLQPLKAVAPPAVVQAVQIALNKDPADRYAGAADMGAALQAALDQSGSIPVSPPVSTPTPMPYANPIIEPVTNIVLTPAEETLLRQAFAGHDRLYLEKEFSSGYSGARVLLVTPVRSGGRRLAQLVLKIDVPSEINREWQAYQAHVKDNLPPVTARILEAPIRSENKQRALLRYTFAGGSINNPPESLRSYYARHSGPEVADLLEKCVFETFGSKWWLQRRTSDLILRREYDRLLPVHLLLTPADDTETLIPDRTLVAGNINARAFDSIESGQLIEIKNFRVGEIRPEKGELTLNALPPSGSRSNPIRVRIRELPPERMNYRVGQTIASLHGVVIATQRDLLYQRVEPVLPDQDLAQKEVSIGNWLYPNPLFDYKALLDQRLSIMESIIHGDLNMENILVTPSPAIAWLIDFATTGRGHNLYDFMRLETQVLTKLLPPDTKPEDVADMLIGLHQFDTPGSHLPAALQKAYAVLIAIRRMVRVCMYSRENWDEYYLGLIITLLGSLKFKELPTATRAATFAAAAALRSLIEKPDLRHPRRALVTATPPAWTRHKLAAGAGLLVGLVILAILGLWKWGGFASPTPTPTSQQTLIVANTTPAATDEITTEPPSPPSPTDTPTLLPTPCIAEGIATDRIDVYDGPDLAYAVAGQVRDQNAIAITGRTFNSQWWQINHPGGPDGLGWVEAKWVELPQTCLPPRISEFPPLPTPTNTTTATATPLAATPASSPVTSTLSSPVLMTAFSGITLDNFDYCNLSSLQQSYTINDAWGANQLTLELTDPAGANGQAVALTYEIASSGSDNYVGLQRDIPTALQNWSHFRSIQFWVQNDANYKNIVFQWGEAQFSDGEVWQADYQLLPDQKEVFEIPLTKQNFSKTDWSPDGNGEMDLEQVSFYALFIEQTGGSSGAVSIDDVRLNFVDDPCRAEPAAEFKGLFDTYSAELGCAVDTATTIPFHVAEAFEGGHLFWREDTNDVYVIYDRDKGTEVFSGEWNNPACQWNGTATGQIGVAPPANRIEPERGFGWLWRIYLDGPSGRLGWAIEQEQGLRDTGRAQLFENGFAFKSSGSKTYALLKTGRFLAHVPGLTTPSTNPPVTDDSIDPEPSSEPTPTGFLPDNRFEPLWEKLGSGSSPLGYPLGQAIKQRNYARQPFERGFMYWWDSPNEPQPIWVVEAAGSNATKGESWQRYNNEWKAGMPEYPPDCSTAAPPNGPKSGFGLIWCYQTGVKDSLGAPLEAEFGSGNVFDMSTVQYFQHGVMLDNPYDKQVWAFVDDNGWYRFSY